MEEFIPEEEEEEQCKNKISTLQCVNCVGIIRLWAILVVNICLYGKINFCNFYFIYKLMNINLVQIVQFLMLYILAEILI